jgi:HSP20 family protein
MIIRRLRHPAGFRWGAHPFAALDQRMREFQQLFDALDGDRRENAGVFPPMNIEEDADNYYICAELPGMDPKGLEIETLDKTLTISGERKIPDEGTEVSYHRREREAGTFRRSVSFPSPINPEKVDANYKCGVLTMTLAKADEAKPKQITVKAS